MTLGILQEIENETVGGFVTKADQIRDSRTGKNNQSLNSSLDEVTEPEMFNAIWIANDGTTGANGKNLQNAVPLLGEAMTLAAALTPTDHKVITSYEARNYGDFINDGAPSNFDVFNLSFIAQSAILENINMTHKGHIDIRRCIGNVVMGSGSSLIIGGALGYLTQARTLTFAAGAHHGTQVVIKEVLADVTISFAGVTSGSLIELNILDYKASDLDAAIDTLKATIPEGVTVVGRIGNRLLGEGSRVEKIPSMEDRITQLEGHQSITVIDENILEVAELPHPTEATPAQAVIQLLPSSDRTKLIFVSKAGGADKNGVVFRAEYDAAASPINVASVTANDVTTITIGFGTATNTIRQLADLIEAHADFPTADWHVDSFFYANHSVAITNVMTAVEDTTNGGKNAPTSNFVQVPTKFTVPFDSGLGGGVTHLPGLYQLVDNIANAGRFRAKLADNGNGYDGFWLGSTYPASGGLSKNFGEEVFMPNAGGVLGLYRNYDGGLHDYTLWVHEGMYYGAMVDRVRYVWATVSDPRQRGDENADGVTPVVANPHEFDPSVVIHDNLVVSFYRPGDLSTAHTSNVAFNITGTAITVGGVRYRKFESLAGTDFLAQYVGDEFTEIDMRLDVDHNIRVLRNWRHPYAQDDWNDVNNLHQDTQTKTWKAVDVFHPTVGAINKELNDLAKRVRALENP